jgi:hypothetical protein
MMRSRAAPLRNRKFADSRLEEGGFELVVPLQAAADRLVFDRVDALLQRQRQVDLLAEDPPGGQPPIESDKTSVGELRRGA